MADGPDALSGSLPTGTRLPCRPGHDARRVADGGLAVRCPVICGHAESDCPKSDRDQAADPLGALVTAIDPAKVDHAETPFTSRLRTAEVRRALSPTP
jgi:hypothetical protein